MCAPWFGKFLNVFKNIFEVISDHIMNESNLEDFPKAKNTTSQKCIAKQEFFLYPAALIKINLIDHSESTVISLEFLTLQDVYMNYIFVFDFPTWLIC